MCVDQFAVAEIMQITADHLKAVNWRTGMIDDACVRCLARALPEAVLEEVLMRWKDAQMSVAEPFPKQDKF